MVTQINEDEIPEQYPDIAVDNFFNLSKGETVKIFAWNGNEEYIKTDFTVTDTKRTQTKEDDYIYGEIDGSNATLRLLWMPAEPDVGIPKPYYEPPITLEYKDESYDVVVLKL